MRKHRFMSLEIREKMKLRSKSSPALLVNIMIWISMDILLLYYIHFERFATETTNMYRAVIDCPC